MLLQGPWTIAPGEVQSLLMNWGAWLTSESAQGFNLYEMHSASLWDMGTSPPQIADPAIIKITSGMINDPDPPDNSDVADLVSVMPPYGTQTLIAVAKDARVGALYRLDLCVVACDGCAGRKIRMCDCVVIAIAEC